MDRFSIATLFLVFLGGVIALDYKDLVNDEFQVFKMAYGKVYANQIEEHFRERIFVDNRRKIARHNLKYHLGLSKYSLKMNRFGDLLHTEFDKTMNGYKKIPTALRKYNGSAFLAPANVQIPDQVDWRDAGYVTPVKDQGKCGSCWTFSSTGALEGQHFKKTGKLIDLSEQNLIDCASEYGTQGCEGGNMDPAFQYIKENKGIDTETSYPYDGKDMTCRFKARHVGATDSGFVDVEEGDEDEMKKALATVGPISVAIDASPDSFQFYGGGVYTDPGCSSTETNHAVLAVGYGTEEGQDYWLIKNSWGESWGDDGYIKIARNMEDMCGVASSPSYPLV